MHEDLEARQLSRVVDDVHAAEVQADALAALDLAHAVHDHARRLEARAEARVPQPARACEAHAAEVAAARRLGRVEVRVRVDPKDACFPMPSHEHRQRRDRDRALGGEQDRHAARLEGIGKLAAGLEQAAACVAQVVRPAARARLARRADDPCA